MSSNEQRDKLSEDLKCKMYDIVVHLRASGDIAYHNLTNTYVIVNSILIVSLSGIMSPLLKRPSNYDKSEYFLYWPFILIFIISTIGAILCIQMWLAQWMYRSKNHYLEEELIAIEICNNWTKPNLFNNLRRLLDNQEVDKKENKNQICALIKAKEQKKYIKFRILTRMKSFPYLFLIIYILFLIFDVFKFIETLCQVSTT